MDAVMIEGTVTSLSQADVDQYNLFDHLGSLRTIVDNVSAIVDEIVYNSFGVVSYESAPATAHFAGFAGGHVDANTGLVNDYHRWYDPATGKWLNEDPLTFAAGDEDLTRYVANDPTGLADPIGLFPPPPSRPTFDTDEEEAAYIAEMRSVADQIRAQVLEMQAQARRGWRPPFQAHSWPPVFFGGWSAEQLQFYQAQRQSEYHIFYTLDALQQMRAGIDDMLNAFEAEVAASRQRQETYQQRNQQAQQRMEQAWQRTLNQQRAIMRAEGRAMAEAMEQIRRYGRPSLM